MAWLPTITSNRDWHWRSVSSGPACTRIFATIARPTIPSQAAPGPWKGPNSPVIINLFTQEPPASDQDRPGKASLPNVNHALQALKKELQERGVKSVALPRLATGVGGLEWEKVYPLLQQALKELTIPVYVYSLYRKGVAAQEIG